MSAPGEGLPSRTRRLRLWVKLALLAGAGVFVTHAVHLAVGTRVATRALAREQEALGRGIARLVASDAADAILTHDTVALSQLVTRASSTKGIAYCFVVRDGSAISSSFPAGTPAALVHLRDGGAPEAARQPVVVVDGEARYLDLEEPILEGKVGAVRLGIRMEVLQSTRRAIAVPLGLLAACVILLGTAAALLIGRSLARPMEDIVAAADHFDPAQAIAPVAPRGGVEIAMLADRFNGMMARLRASHLERERLREQALANARLASLGRIVAGVAHEVNNPIASLKACVALLREEPDPKERAADLGLMERAVDRLHEIVRRLLDLGSPRPPELSPTSLLDLAREAPQLAALSLRLKGIALEELVDPGAEQDPVIADRKQIGQALLNLILNAAHVSKPGSRIRVRLRRAGTLRGIAVEDDGPGIPPEIRDQIFDPFFTTKTSGEGTGLGLALARTIVQQHHGELAFEFPDTGGTVATIWLPVAAFPRGSHAALGGRAG